MAEKPEQMLPQYRAPALVFQQLSRRDDCGHEEACSQQSIEQHHHAGHEQSGKRQQRHHRGDENAPQSQGHAHQGHASGPGLKDGHHIIQPTHREADDEQDKRDQHHDDAPVRPRRALQDRLRRIERPARPGWAARNKETRDQHEHRQQVHPETEHVYIRKHHVPGANHQRDQVVAEPAEKQRGEKVDHHDHAVHGDELIIGAGVNERQQPWKSELNPDKPREH